MKASEVRELSVKEREEKVSDLRKEYFNLKFQLATGKIENPNRLYHLRKDIARIKTIQREAGDGEAEKKAEPAQETETKK